MPCPKKLIGDIELNLLLLDDYCRTQEGQKALEAAARSVKNVQRVINKDYDVDRCKIK